MVITFNSLYFPRIRKQPVAATRPLVSGSIGGEKFNQLLVL